VDGDILAVEAGEAAEEIKILRRAMEEARAELGAGPERLALEGDAVSREGDEDNK
jgi:hypothetical protein